MPRHVTCSSIKRSFTIRRSARRSPTRAFAYSPGVRKLETLEFENCAAITDTGLRELTRLPRLRRLSAWSCINVEGAWTTSAPSGVEAKSEAAPPEQSAGYRAETLIDYPDMVGGSNEQ